MENIKKIEQNLDEDIQKLIEFSREILRISRNRKKEKLEKTKENTPYEEAKKINPYISKYDTISYY